ncbi:MAG: hypothetical protein LLG04_14045 [Parachlamydia sp.]|nr:hypothetical protein [Parachlamydia sp.]
MLPAAAPTIQAAVVSSEDEARRRREEATFNPPDYFRKFIQINHGTSNQELYNRRSLEIVNAAAEAVKAELKAKKDPTLIFRNLLERLASERQTLAKELGSPKAELFGQWMDRDGSDSFLATSLGGEQYQRYGNRILELIQKNLRELTKAKETTYHKNDKDFWKGWGDDQCRVYVKVIGLDTVQRWTQVQQGGVLTKENYGRLHDINEVLVQTKDGIKITCADIGKGLLLLNNWYTHCPEAKGTQFAHNLKNGYILMTVVLKIEGVWRTMTSYLTWVYEDHPYQLTEEIIARMGRDCVDFKDRFVRKQSAVVILHNAKKDKIDAVIHATGKIFAQIATWDGKDRKQLNHWIDEVDYNLVQLNPWLRGAGAIVKYVDGVMHKIHGDELIPYDSEKFPDLEVHANPYKPNFIKNNHKNYKS